VRCNSYESMLPHIRTHWKLWLPKDGYFFGSTDTPNKHTILTDSNTRCQQTHRGKYTLKTSSGWWSKDLVISLAPHTHYHKMLTNRRSISILVGLHVHVQWAPNRRWYYSERYISSIMSGASRQTHTTYVYTTWHWWKSPHTNVQVPVNVNVRAGWTWCREDPTESKQFLNMFPCPRMQCQ